MNNVRIINNSWNYEQKVYNEKCHQIDEYMYLLLPALILVSTTTISLWSSPLATTARVATIKYPLLLWRRM